MNKTHVQATVSYLPNKTMPTWMVQQGNDKWFFLENNGSAFKHPRDRAKTLCAKLNKDK